MKKTVLCIALAAALSPLPAMAADPFSSLTKLWTYNHAATSVVGQTSEISAFDSVTNSLWVAGVAGVDVLNATNGSLIGHIDTTAFGSIISTRRLGASVPGSTR